MEYTDCHVFPRIHIEIFEICVFSVNKCGILLYYVFEGFLGKEHIFELFWDYCNRWDMYVFAQFFPHTGVFGFKQCRANHYTIIDFVILYKRGINTIHLCITLVHVAALVEGDGAGPAKDKPPSPENEEADEDGYGPGFLHILFTMFETFSTASIRAGWFCVRVWPSPTVRAQETNMRVKEAAMTMVAVRLKLKVENWKLKTD